MDKAALLAAVRQDWRRLRDAPDELRGDLEVIVGALTGDPQGSVPAHSAAFEHATPGAKADLEIVRKVVGLPGKGRALRFAVQELRGNRDVVMAAVRSRASALEFATPGLRADKDLVLEAFRSILSTGRAACWLWRAKRSGRTRKWCLRRYARTGGIWSTRPRRSVGTSRWF